MARRRPPSEHDADVEYGSLQNTSADESTLSDYGPDVESRHASIVDFSSVALYMPGLQTTLALVVCCLTSILVGLSSAAFSGSAVRTATLTTLAGTLVVCRPIRIAYARGIDVMFDALRPAVLVYVLALVLEQLVHSCGVGGDGSITLRHWAYHAFTVAMAVAGFVQAWNPTSKTDYPFVVVSLSLVAVACFTPPPMRSGEGPLCDAPAMAGAVERFFRALLFGCTYCALAYASEPTRHSVQEIVLCAVRATTGSVWILCVHRYLVGASVAQALLVMWSRLKSQPGRHSATDSPLMLGGGAGAGATRLDLHRAPAPSHGHAHSYAHAHAQAPTYSNEPQSFQVYNSHGIEGYGGGGGDNGVEGFAYESTDWNTNDPMDRYGGGGLRLTPGGEFSRVEELSPAEDPAPISRNSLRVTLGAPPRPSLRPAGVRCVGEGSGGMAMATAPNHRNVAEDQRRMELVARQIAED